MKKYEMRPSNRLTRENILKAVNVYLEMSNPNRISLDGKIKYNPQAITDKLMEELTYHGAIRRAYIDYNLPKVKIKNTYLWVSRTSKDFGNAEYLLRAEMDQERGVNMDVPRGSYHMLCSAMFPETEKEEKAHPIAWKITRKWMDERLPTWYGYAM